MKRTTVLNIIGFGSCAVVATGCADAVDGSLSVQQETVIGVDSHLYFRCNATGWGVDDPTRLVEQAPGVFSLSYEVAQSWIVSDADTCIITQTDELNGWGTEQTFFGKQSEGMLSVPGGDDLDEQLQGEDEHFKVSYPEVGDYRVTVDWPARTFFVEADEPTTVLCGSEPACEVNAGQCCHDINTDTSMCQPEGGSCITTTDVPITCDEAADCTGDAVCCLFATTTGSSAFCTTSCSGATGAEARQICDPDSPDECNAGTCTEADRSELPDGYFTCQ